MNFDKLGLSDSLLKAVKVTGYTKPTLIQEKAIPAILSGKDVMAAAQTGTGKTAGFTLPLLQLLNWKKKTTPYEIRALVLNPTRELAAQVKESTDARWRGRRVGYWADFDTTAGETKIVDIPFADFFPQYRGFKLDGPELNIHQISEFALYQYDKTDGPFELRLISVQAYVNSEDL